MIFGTWRRLALSGAVWRCLGASCVAWRYLAHCCAIYEVCDVGAWQPHVNLRFNRKLCALQVTPRES